MVGDQVVPDLKKKKKTPQMYFCGVKKGEEPRRADFFLGRYIFRKLMSLRGVGGLLFVSCLQFYRKQHCREIGPAAGIEPTRF